MARLAGITGLFVLLAAGCSRDAGPRQAVRGRVFYQGQPVPGGTIVFSPDPDRNGQGPLARGAILNDGSYDLAAGPDQGAVAGWHRVTVLPAMSAATFALPPKYADPEQCGQSCEIKTGQPNVIDFHLQ